MLGWYGDFKIENRAKGYGSEAIALIIDYGFKILGMERISANTLNINIGAQKSIEKYSLTLEGRERNPFIVTAKNTIDCATQF